MAREDGVRRVAVIGNYSGRNSGDAALLEGLLRDVTETFPETRLEFVIPTINPGFVRRTYGSYPVRPVGLLPWNLSLKILGLPIVRTVLGADLVLVTDAILFDRKLYNPTFNYLHTLSWVLPMGARRGVPIVLYNVSLGALSTEAGERCLRRVLEASARVVVRDLDSAVLARELRPDVPEPIVAADCALSAHPAPEADLAPLLTELGLFSSDRPVLGFNVNAYVDVYVRGDRPPLGDETFQRDVAAVLDRAVRELGVDILMVQTQAMDVRMAEGVLAHVEARDRVRMVTNRDRTHAELTSLVGKVDAFVGMRTHSLILAASMHTPIGGIITYPKTRGFLEAVDCGEEKYEFSNHSADALWRFVRSIWERREPLRSRLQVSVERERAKARAAATELAPWLS
jgi:polysaccharide pyruvyl transferase WcaK-like protein